MPPCGTIVKTDGTTEVVPSIISRCLKPKSKWKLFQDFWQINNLAQEKWTMQETGKIPLRAGDIDEIFGS